MSTSLQQSRPTLLEGNVEDGYVECWMHGSRFDLTTGVPTGPPANQPVPVYPVRITDTGIDVVLPADPRRRGTWLWPQAGSLARIFPLARS